MAEVLAPCLELLGVFAVVPAQLDKGISETMFRMMLDLILVEAAGVEP